MTTSFLERNGGRLAYDVTGPDAGPLVVCAPGMGELRQSFRFLAPQVADAGYRVVTVDTRGHGESSTGWPSYTPDDVGDDLVELVEYLGGPAVLVGHSSACASVLAAAADHPELVRGVVLISTASGDRRISPLMKVPARAVGRSATLWAMFYRSQYRTAKPADFDHYVATMKANLREPGRMAAVGGLIDAALTGITPRYSELRCPSLIIMGTKDRDVRDPRAEVAAVTRKLHNTPTVELIGGSGHYPQAEMPDVTATAIVKFLAAL